MAGTGACKSATAETTLACLLCLCLSVAFVDSAPATHPEERFLETTELAEYGNLGGSGAGAGPGGGLVEPSDCYYNFQRYAEGDRIVTNEPCLNCTCHSRMLMCYLRVCPFSKAIGQDCKVEKRPDQCCPVITCPEVPVHLLTSTSTTEKVPSDTSVAFPDTYGCSIDGRFFPDGVQVPSNPEKPCELCYCIRNRTACVMQECTLQVEGCKPILQPGVCCPVRYDCDYGDEPSATERPPPSGLILSTPTTPGPAGCTAGGYLYRDGDRVRGRTPCEHCYCMRGDVVCAVQECGPALQGCHALPPKPGRCCPDAFQCANGTVSLEILSQDQNTPEPHPIPSGSIEDKHQVVASASLPTEAPLTEPQKDNVVTEGKFPATEKYEPTTVSSSVEVGTPVKGVKGEVANEEPTTMKYEPEEPTRQPEEELLEGTTTRGEIPEVDPVKDPAHSESDAPEATQPEDSLPTSASPSIDKEIVPSEESNDHFQHNTQTAESDDNNEEPSLATTEPPLLGAPTSHVADDKIEDTPVTSEPLIETHDDKTTATFVTVAGEYPTTPTVRQTCKKAGQTFELLDPVPARLVTDNPCVVNCTCKSNNAITCAVVNCPPSPPHHKNCVPIRHEGVCCPTYACDGIEAPEPESDSQMGVSHDGSDKGNEITTNAPIAEELTMITAEYSRQTSSEIMSNVPLKEATTSLPIEPYQPTTVSPIAESSEKESAVSADQPIEGTQAAPAQEHKPVETEQHTYDEGAHSHDGEEIHEDSESHPHFDHEEHHHTSAPEEAGLEPLPATEEPHTPEPIEDHTIVETEAEPSHQNYNEIDDPTQKLPQESETAAPEEEKHETSHPAEIPTTQHYVPDDVGNVVTSSPNESEPESSLVDKLHEPNDSEPAPSHTTSGYLDHTFSPIDSESQVITGRPSEENPILGGATTFEPTLGDHKDSQSTHDGSDLGSADEIPSQTTVAAPVKKDDTVTEQEKYPTTEKPAELSSDAVVQPEHNTPAPSETSESSPAEQGPEVEVTPIPSANVDEVEHANDNIQLADALTDKPVVAEPTDVPAEIVTEKPGDVALDTEPATAAPVGGAEDAPGTETPTIVDYSTDLPESSGIKGSDHTTVVHPEVTEAPAMVHLTETPGGSPPEAATESAPEPQPSFGTERPADFGMETSRPDKLPAGTDAPLEAATDKPALVVENQTEKGSEETPSVTESMPETPSHDSHEEDLSHEMSGTEEPPKDNENKPQQPYVTVLPFEEATPEKVDGILHEDHDNTGESFTASPLLPEASTDPGNQQTPGDSQTQSPVAADGSEKPTQEETTTDKFIAHHDQSTENLLNVNKEPTTVQSESPTEAPTHLHTEAVDTEDENLEATLQPTTETPLKLVSSDSNELATESSVSSSSNSPIEQYTELPERTPQPVDTFDEEQQVTTLKTSVEAAQDHVDENPIEVSHDHSDGIHLEDSHDHTGETPEEIPLDHTDSTPGETSQDKPEETLDEVVHHTEGPSVDVSENHLDETFEEVTQHSVDGTHVGSSQDHSDEKHDEAEEHTDGTPAETSHDHADGTPAESSHDHTDITPVETSHGHTDGTTVQISEDHKDGTPAETSHDHADVTPEETSENPTDEIPVESPHDHTDITPVEIPHHHTDRTPIETSHDYTDGIPTEASHDHTDGTLIETSLDHTDVTPVDTSHGHSDGLPVQISENHTDETPVEASHDHADVIPIEISHDHTDQTPIETLHDHTGETPNDISENHTDVTPVESSHDHTDGTPTESSQDHTDGIPSESSHADGVPVEIHDHTDRTPADSSQDHTDLAPVNSTLNHIDETPAERPADLPEHSVDAHEDITEGPYSPETVYPTTALTEAPTQSQTEPSSAQTVNLHHYSPVPVHDKISEVVTAENTAEPAPTSGEALIQTTTDRIAASQTSLPDSAETTQPHHDGLPTLTEHTLEETNEPERSSAAPEIHVTEPSIATVVPEDHVHIPVENLEGPPPVEFKPVEIVTQSNAEDKFGTVTSASPSVTTPHNQRVPIIDIGSVPVETASQLHTTAVPENSQGLKEQSSVDSAIVAATAEPDSAPVTVSEQVVSQTTQSHAAAASVEEGVKESSTAAEVEQPTSATPTQEKGPSSPENTPSSSLLDQEETTTLPDRITVLPQAAQEQTTTPQQHTGKQPDLHVTEQATHVEPEQSTHYPAPHKDRPTTLFHQEPTSSHTTPTQHKYTTTASPVTEASSKAPFYPSDDNHDYYDTIPVHEHEYTPNKDPAPTVPPSVFGGGHIEDEHPAYGSHMPTTPSHNPFGPPDEPFPVDSDTDDEDPGYGPGTCRYAGKVYVSAQQIPRDDPCDFCFCFRSDIICLQQSCPPPIPGCHEEPISGFCCPRYECPVSMATSLNLTTTSTTTTTTLPPHFLPHAYHGAATRTGCQVRGVAYRVGETVRSASGPCLHCRCGGDGQMQCEPKVCSPEPMLRKMIAAAATRRR